MPSATEAASIIVPTFREAANLERLIERTFKALNAAGITAEMIIVDDDSQDGTSDIIDTLRSRYPIRLIVRHGQRGLSAAVVRGITEAQFGRMVVLDADLQHPPEAIPELLEALNGDTCEFVLGSRYGAGGSLGTRWPLYRRVASKFATMLAWPLASVSDPMSGFFAFRKVVWERSQGLNPIGYKIALELLVKSRCRHVAEVPIHFQERVAGTSKLGARVALSYLRHLMQLYAFRYPKSLFAIGALILAGVALVVWKMR